MSNETTIKITGMKSDVLDALKELEAHVQEIGRVRDIGAGTAPLNSPVDPEMIREATVAVTVLLSSSAGVLVCAEKLLDIAIRVKKKFKILVTAEAEPISIEPNTSMKEVSELIKKAIDLDD